MINIALSNHNSQGIQKILEDRETELQDFLRIAGPPGGRLEAAQQLAGLLLSEHHNVNSEDE